MSNSNTLDDNFAIKEACNQFNNLLFKHGLVLELNEVVKCEYTLPYKVKRLYVIGIITYVDSNKTKGRIKILEANNDNYYIGQEVEIDAIRLLMEFKGTVLKVPGYEGARVLFGE